MIGQSRQMEKRIVPKNILHDAEKERCRAIQQIQTLPRCCIRFPVLVPLHVEPLHLVAQSVIDLAEFRSQDTQALGANLVR